MPRVQALTAAVRAADQLERDLFGPLAVPVFFSEPTAEEVAKFEANWVLRLSGDGHDLRPVLLARGVSRSPHTRGARGPGRECREVFGRRLRRRAQANPVLAPQVRRRRHHVRRIPFPRLVGSQSAAAESREKVVRSSEPSEADASLGQAGGGGTPQPAPEVCLGTYLPTDSEIDDWIDTLAKVLLAGVREGKMNVSKTAIVRYDLRDPASSRR